MFLNNAARPQLLVYGVCFYFLFAVLSSSSLAFGQLGTASIRGIVTDPGGAIVPNAQVVIKNEQTGIVTELTTDGNGRYVAPSLAIGQYQVQIQRQGFETALRANVVLAVGEQREVNVSLLVGQMKQEVVVQEQAAQVPRLLD